MARSNSTVSAGITFQLGGFLQLSDFIPFEFAKITKYDQ